MKTNLQVTRKPDSKFILIEVTFKSARNRYLSLEIYKTDIENYSRLKPQVHKNVVKCLNFLLYAGYKREKDEIEDFKSDLSSDINYMNEIFSTENYTLLSNPNKGHVVTKAKIQEYAKKWDDIKFYPNGYVSQDSKFWVYYYLTFDLDTF